jgi:hypothetical protein
LDKEKIDQRIDWLLRELRPLQQHPDIFIYPNSYDADRDTMYFEVQPRTGTNWSETAYRFAQDCMKYDRGSHIFGIDGQPRVSYSGFVWARYIGDYEDGSKVAFHIFSEQPSHREAEEQLGRLYSLFMERNGLEPMDVFGRYIR